MPTLVHGFDIAARRTIQKRFGSHSDPSTVPPILLVALSDGAVTTETRATLAVSSAMAGERVATPAVSIDQTSADGLA